MKRTRRAAALLMLLLFLLPQAGQAFAADVPSSAQQIFYAGGAAANDGDSVSVSKTVQGTETENVFDITLTVQTEQNIEAQTAYPPLSVVLLMDISNTMNLSLGSTTRYEAAMAAAEQFMQSFAAAAGDGDALRQVGFAAFNTDAHVIFPLSDCRTEAQVQALSAQMRADTAAILNTPNYDISPQRFTNIEAGLKLAGDMLAASSAPYKGIILLSDGRPTTYLRFPETAGSYEGWNPIMKQGNPGYDNGSIGEAGYFYNQKRDMICYAGTNYSDRAADRASARAAAVRQSGIDIYAIGVGVQTLSDIASLNPATIDCYPEGVPYVMGTDVQQYTAWLRDSIAGGNYYDTEDSDALQSAYAEILAAVTKEAQNAALADWVISDAMNADADYIEFLGFFAADGSYTGSSSLAGSSSEGAENTAVFDADADTVSWDLKNSGYSAVDDGAGHTVFHYTIRYRVRLKNEAAGFAAGQTYTTNGTTVLRYRLLQNGELSQLLALPFPIPQVTGYLGSLRFQKTDAYGDPLAGAVFTLAHDPTCESCAALAVPVNVAALTAASAENGETEFSAIPSGHSYLLTEQPPQGYETDGSSYRVTVAYGQTAVRVLDAAAQPQPWTGSIANSRAEGSAVIRKTVTGAGDTAELFDFTVTLTHGDGTPFTEAVMWQRQNAAGSTLASGKLLPNEAGALSLQLRHGEQIALSRIPQGVRVVISEQERAGYTVSVNGQQGSSFAGVIGNDGVLTAAFENYRPRTNVNTGA